MAFPLLGRHYLPDVPHQQLVIHTEVVTQILASIQHLVWAITVIFFKNNFGDWQVLVKNTYSQETHGQNIHLSPLRGINLNS